jgi:hypothetical protein
MLLDEFEHFGQTFGDINVSLTLDSPYVGSNLPIALYVKVSGVFQTLSVPKPFIPVKVLCENVKYFSSSITINFWSQKCFQRRNRQN